MNSQQDVKSDRHRLRERNLPFPPSNTTSVAQVPNLPVPVPSDMPRFLLEIGTEEIPPRFFPPALAQLKEEGARMLQRARLAYGELKVYGTPRRLVLIAEGLAAHQASATREERGPAARAAFTEDGQPTKAALGFARRHGVAPETLEVRETDQGPYVFAVITEAELPATDALAELLPGLITGLSFPKSMRWGEGKLRFGRPIRWLLALVDEEVVEFELEGIRSGRETRGHPVLAEGMFGLAAASDYERALVDHFVLVDPDDRKRRIEEQLTKVARDEHATWLHGGRWYDWPVSRYVADPDAFAADMAVNLVLQTTFLVEWPTCVIGRYDESFVDLPQAVRIEEMQRVQSYFPVAKPLQAQDEAWELLPLFAAVRDGGDEHIDDVVSGWENVLRAKLIDAQFFYQQDKTTALADRVDALRGVIFQEKLGTMGDKVDRIRAVADVLAEELDLGEEPRKWLDRAALLCKADLVTELVTELPQLQGEMGAVYAAAAGEPEEVSAAIRDHYRPRFAGDDTPYTTIGNLLAIADKIDTVTACFAVGVSPTGSQDPFALRREASGLARCLTENPSRPQPSDVALARVSLGRLVKAVLKQARTQGIEPILSDEEVVRQVWGFVGERLETHLRQSGVRHDLVRAGLAPGVDRLGEAFERACALGRLSETDDFLPTVIAATRPINISKDFEGGDVDPDLFQEDAERELWSAYQKVAAEADRVPLVELFRLFGTELRGPIDRYFDDVLVMAEDEKLRRNRLAMCWQLSQLFRRLADFSLVVQA